MFDPKLVIILSQADTFKLTIILSKEMITLEEEFSLKKFFIITLLGKIQYIL